MDLLTRQLRSSLMGGALSAPIGITKEIISDAIDVAMANKLLLFFAKSSLPSTLDDGANKTINGHRTAVAHLNGHVLHLATKVSSLFRLHGVEHFFFKGPLQQKILYGNFFAKSSVDLDVFVRRSDFAQARELLISAGFALPSDRSSLWWTFFLGEQPFIRADSSSPSVDLHHRLQQPGCPTPRRLDYFFNTIETVHVGSLPVPTVGLKGIVLITAMNLLKAVYHREPGGSYAFDIITGLKMLGPDGAANLVVEAAQLDLRRSLLWATRMAAATFQVANPLVEWKIDGGIKTDEIPRVSLLRPQAGIEDFPKRRNLLLKLIDRPIPNAGMDYGRWLLSEGARIVFER